MRYFFIAIFVTWHFGNAISQLRAQPFPSEELQEFLEEAEGEEEDEIETDRDSFTPATTTAGACNIIFEAAYSFIDNRSVPETHSYPEMLLRVGANEWLELRLGWNYEVGGAGNPVSGNIPSDLSEEAGIETEHRLLYGFKAKLTDQDAWIPDSAIILQGFTPTGGESHKTEMSATYVWGWVLANDWTWDTAIRYGTSELEEDNFNVWSPSTVVKIPLGERWKAHVEYFGVFSDHRDVETAQYFISPGAHYLVTPNFEIGVRVGWGLNDESPNFFSNAGIGYRF